MRNNLLTISRRTFLGACAALAPVASLRAARVAKLNYGFTSYQWGAEWDLPTLIDNCAKAGALGVELRTDIKHKHGVELNLDAEGRQNVKQQFADSPVKLLTINCGERFDSPEPAALRESIEKAKTYVLLARDVGAAGIRVFPNDFHKEVPEEQTIAQIAKSLNELGRYAQDYSVLIRLENHGTAGRLTTLRKVMDLVDQKNVRIKLNGDVEDNENGQFAKNFALVQDRLDDTLHMRLYRDYHFPYQEQFNLLAGMGWQGWCIVEEEDVKVADNAQGLIDEKKIFDKMVAKAMQRA
jgi:sugar phosphate isomerase/epimerase